MAETKKTNLSTARPAMFMAVVILIAVVIFAALTGLYAMRNDTALRQVITSIERNWDMRVASYALPEQEQAKNEAAEDKRRLSDVAQHYDSLRMLLSFSIVGLVLLALVAFTFYQLGLVQPLRRLEASCRDLLEKNLNGHVWGLDRDDQFGAVARAISDIRKTTTSLTDMVVMDEKGQSRVQFEGQSAGVFNALVGELKDSITTLKQQGLRLESISTLSEEKIAKMNENALQQSQTLSASIEGTRGQLMRLENEWQSRLDDTRNSIAGVQADMAAKLDALFHQNNQVAGQAKTLTDQFGRDMGTLREIAAVTGQRVTQALQAMTASDRDMRKAAQQSLEASATFGKQAADVSEKLIAATNLLRASGKVMQETTDSTRQRLTEAVNSVAGHDAALRAFLADTAEKTDSITSILGDMARNATAATSTVEQFDARMAQFEEKVDGAFARIEDSSGVIGRIAGQMDDAHGMIEGSLQAMGSHSEALSRILVAIRDEYAVFSSEWKNSIAEAGPAIGQLRNVSEELQAQLKNEWAEYARQSHALLSSLEGDVRNVSSRTSTIIEGSEKILTHFAGQAQRMADGANHFDLQLANLSGRLENAASLVVQSNDGLIQRTGAQINDMHTAVQDMVQRLGILTQLTGTLGSVAGQLGQIVPTLGDAAHMARTGIPALPPHMQVSDAVMQKLEEVAGRFSGTVENMHSEFEGVRGQISKWVEMLTGGYKNMAAQIEGFDGALSAKIEALQNHLDESLGSLAAPQAPAINLGDELVPAMKLVHEGLEKGIDANNALLADLRKLQGEVHVMAEGVGQTASSLTQLGSYVDAGFKRIQDEAPSRVQVDASRVEQASAMLEALLQMMQGQSSSFMQKLADVSSRLSEAAARIENQKDSAGELAPGARANLDQLHTQIERIASVLDACAGVTTKLAQNPSQPLSADKSRALKQTVQAAMKRLQSIAESIERIAPETKGDSEAGKTNWYSDGA